MRRVLDGPVFRPSQRVHVDGLVRERKAQGIRNTFTEVRIGGGSIPELMVQVRDASQLQSALVAQGVERMQECHRVGAARQGDAHPGRRCGEVMPLERPPNTIDQRHAVAKTD
jgi:hypothetical protein